MMEQRIMQFWNELELFLFLVPVDLGLLAKCTIF